MISFIKNSLLIAALNLTIFLTLQFLIENSLIFEKISLSSVLTTILLVTIKKINYQRFSILLIVYILMILSLVNVDRSKSFYILHWVNDNEITYFENGSINLSQFPDINQRISEVDFVGRVEEHKKRGLITQNRGSIKLTEFGISLLSVANFLAELFKLDGWVGKD